MWSKATTERFIQSIEKHQVLYDVTMSDYKNQVTQATARAVIGREFQSVCCLHFLQIIANIFFLNMLRNFF
jgi:hypothetical protein